MDAFETFTEASKSARGNLDLSPSVFLSSESSSTSMSPYSPGRDWQLQGGMSSLFNSQTPWDTLIPAMSAGLANPLLVLSPIGMGSFAGSSGMGTESSERTREALK